MSVDRFLHSPSFDRSGHRPAAERQLDTSPRPNDPGRPPRSTRPIWQGRGQQRSATIRGGERGTGSGGPGAGDISMMRVDVLDMSLSRSRSPWALPSPPLPALPHPTPTTPIFFFLRVAARLVWKACERRVLTEHDSLGGDGVSSHLTDPHRVPLPLLGPPLPPPVMQTGF